MNRTRIRIICASACTYTRSNRAPIVEAIARHSSRRNRGELESSHFVDRVEADDWGLENPGEALPYGALSGERQTTQNNQHRRRIHAPTLPNFTCTCRSADRSRAPDPRAGGQTSSTPSSTHTDVVAAAVPATERSPADANSTAGASGQASLCGSRETTGPRSWPQANIGPHFRMCIHNLRFSRCQVEADRCSARGRRKLGFVATGRTIPNNPGSGKVERERDEFRELEYGSSTTT